MEIAKIKRIATQFTKFDPDDGRFAAKLADLYADIERYDKAVGHLVLSQRVLDGFMESSHIRDAVPEMSLWGAKIRVSDVGNNIYIASKDETEARWIQIPS